MSAWRKVLNAIAACAASFWIYGGGRTMQETVLPSARGAASGLFLVLVLCIPILVIAGFAIQAIQAKPCPAFWRAIVRIVFPGFLLGAVLSEAWIVLDEARFLKDIAVGQDSSDYGRARLWPNADASLCYDPISKRVWATD